MINQAISRLKAKIETTTLQRRKRLMIALALALSVYLYHDLLFYWLGVPYTNIVRLDVSKLERIQTKVFHKSSALPSQRGQSNFARTTSHNAVEYRTPEGQTIYVYEPERAYQPGVYVHLPWERVHIFYQSLVISSYTPFTAWYEVAIRLPLLLPIWLVVWIFGSNIMERISHAKRSEKRSRSNQNSRRQGA